MRITEDQIGRMTEDEVAESAVSLLAELPEERAMLLIRKWIQANDLIGEFDSEDWPEGGW